MTAMLKGASPIQASSTMAVILTMQLARHRVSCWWEWVDSKANPSDPLSREGYADPDVAKMLQSGAWQAVLCCHDWTALTELDEAALVQ